MHIGTKKIFLPKIFLPYHKKYLLLQRNRKDGRVVECIALEMRRRGDSTGGSNPSLSAENVWNLVSGVFFV